MWVGLESVVSRQDLNLSNCFSNYFLGINGDISFPLPPPDVFLLFSLFHPKQYRQHDRETFVRGGWGCRYTKCPGPGLLWGLCKPECGESLRFVLHLHNPEIWKEMGKYAASPGDG